MKKRKRIGDKILLWAISFVLLFGGVSLTFFPAARVSERENRVLAEMPQLSASNVADGSYATGLDTYAAERFPLRVPLRAARAAVQIGMGKQEVCGVLFCTDGSLCKRITTNERAYAQNLAAIQKLQSTCGERLTVAVAPRRIDARTEVLPPLYDTREDAAVWETLQAHVPDAVTFSALTADAHWYRTDHHWTTEGAYGAYCQLGAALGYTPFTMQAFTKETVSTSFRGTTDAAAGLPFVSPDTIELYRYAGDTAYTVQKDGNPAPFAGFYDTDKLRTRDQYAVFLGGNCGVLEITDGTDRPTLLVIKDSFANSLMPFLARHYNITAIDPRYCTAPITDFTKNADQILFLCGMQTLCTAAILKTA